MTEPEHVVKQLGDLGLVATAELRDRRVIGRAHRADHLVGHVLPARPLDPPRGPVPARIRVQKQCHQHRRVIRRPARATQPIRLASGPDRSHRPPPEPSTPDGPPAATPSTTAASTTTDPAHTKRNLEPSRKCLKPTRQHRYSDSLSRRRVSELSGLLRRLKSFVQVSIHKPQECCARIKRAVVSERNALASVDRVARASG